MENYKALSEHKIRVCFRMYLDYIEKTVGTTELKVESMSIAEIDSELEILYMTYNLSKFFSSAKNSCQVICYIQLRKMIDSYISYYLPKIETFTEPSSPKPAKHDSFIKSLVEDDYILTKRSLQSMSSVSSIPVSLGLTSKSLSALPTFQQNDLNDLHESHVSELGNSTENYLKSPFDITPPISSLPRATKSISLVDSLNNHFERGVESASSPTKGWSFF